VKIASFARLNIGNSLMLEIQQSCGTEWLTIIPTPIPAFFLRTV